MELVIKNGRLTFYYSFKLLLLVLLLCCVLNGFKLNLNFGEICDESVKNSCNLSQHLKCNNNTCDCVVNNSMYYEKGQNSCVVLAGHSMWNGRDFVFFPCGPNSISNQNRVCECKSGFYDSVNGSCLPKIDFQSECTREKECINNLHCHNGKCTCLEMYYNSSFDFSTKNCIGLHGKPCYRRTNHWYPSYCVNNATCRSKICECRMDFKASEEGFCFLAKPKKCEKYQKLDYKRNKCITLVNGSCKSSSECVKNSICKVHDNQTSSCQCELGFSESNTKECDLSFGSDCPEDRFKYKFNFFHTEQANKCNKKAKLFCIDGKCNCLNGLQVYDNYTSSCRGLVGSTCSRLVENYCIEGTSCQSYLEIYLSTSGTCKCVKGYKLSLDGTRCAIN